MPTFKLHSKTEFIELIKKNYKTIIYIFIIAEWLYLDLYLLNMHYPWFDECHAWVLARDLSIKELFNILVYEGHPFLWFLVIMPFAKAGIGIGAMYFVSFFLVGIALVLFLFKTNFSIAEKLIITNSSLFIYYLPVVSRSYCLFPLFFMLLYLFYEKRHETIWYPLLIALFIQVHAYILGFCMSLFILYAIEAIKDINKSNKIQNIKNSVGIFFIIASTLFLSIELYFNPERANNTYSNDSMFEKLFNIKEFSLGLINAIYQIGRQAVYFDYYPMRYMILYRVITVIGFIVIGILIFILNKKMFFVYFISYGYIAFFSALFYEINSNQKAVSLSFILIFILSVIVRQYKKAEHINVHTKLKRRVCLSLRIFFFLFSLLSIKAVIPQYNDSATLRDFTNTDVYTYYKWVNNDLNKDDVVFYAEGVEDFTAYFKESSNIMYNLFTNEFQDYIVVSNGDSTKDIIYNTDFDKLMSEIEKERNGKAEFYIFCTVRSGMVFKEYIDNIPELGYEEMRIKKDGEQTIYRLFRR